MKVSQKDLTNIPVIALVAANVVPLWGVLFLGWDAFYIVLLYWSENLAIGFYNILKIAAAKVEHPLEHLSKLFLIPFFVIHYGGFMAVHGFFVLTMSKRSESGFVGGETWPCFLVFVQMLINVIRQMFSAIGPQMKIAILALFVSHGVSFVYNYLLKGEYAIYKPQELMNKPYSRVVVLHIAIIGGGFLVMSIGSPVALLLGLVVCKTIFDVHMHIRSHRQRHKGTGITATAGVGAKD